MAWPSRQCDYSTPLSNPHPPIPAVLSNGMPITLVDYTHDHPEVRNINELHDSGLTRWDRLADRVTTLLGSWPFILFQSAFILVWIGVNVWLVFHPEQLKAFDPYPFILLNLALSFQAAYTGPIVLMSQNRVAAKDRLVAQSDFECNLTAENEIRLIMDHLRQQDEAIRRILTHLESPQAKQ